MLRLIRVRFSTVAQVFDTKLVYLLPTFLLASFVIIIGRQSKLQDAVYPENSEVQLRVQRHDLSNLPQSDPSNYIRVRVIGMYELRWYFGAFTGSFDVCYKDGYLDPSLRCEYLKDDEPLSKADVVVFRGVKLESPISQKALNESPRPTKQRWVFMENESPYRVGTKTNLSRYNGVFNLTSTFSPESDLHRVDMRRMKVCTKDPEIYERLKDVDYTHKKRNDTVVAWFVSRCRSQSGRESYVRELRKYIAVDIYGRCGTHSCGTRYNNTFEQGSCHEKLLHDNNSYKFYLSFENSLCKYYVTEKLWLLERLDVVPIVMGLVDYEAMLPKGSFINVKDFSTPKELAQYIHMLNRNPEQYNQYIRNKNSLNCQLKYAFKPWECILCQKVHDMKGQSSVVQSLDRVWGSEQCVPPHDYLPNTFP